VNEWDTVANFLQVEHLLDTACPELKERSDYEGLGLKSYRGWVMTLSYYQDMDDRNNGILLHTSSPPVQPSCNEETPADHWIAIPPPTIDSPAVQPNNNGTIPANHWISVSPSTFDKCNMLPLRTQPTKG